MDISLDGPTGAQYAVSVAKLAQSSTKAEGEAAVQLIESAGQVPPPPGVNGEGTHINTYA
ncbi:MAG TPA: hypothetical protein VFP84_20860 [Kofleriaceae bacterium]|nr:hypothetical protein [Kofleriaceae bacterium]